MKRGGEGDKKGKMGRDKHGEKKEVDEWERRRIREKRVGKMDHLGEKG